MPYAIRKSGGKHRIIDPRTGKVKRNANGTPIDGGGHGSYKKALAQLRALYVHVKASGDLVLSDGVNSTRLGDGAVAATPTSGAGNTVKDDGKSLTYSCPSCKGSSPMMKGSATHAHCKSCRLAFPISLSSIWHAPEADTSERNKLDRGENRGTRLQLVPSDVMLSHSLHLEMHDVDPATEVELAGAQGKVYRKELIPEGNFVKVHKDGRVQQIPVDRARLSHWHNTINEMKTDGVRIPLPLEHTRDPDKNRGWVVGAEMGKDSRGRQALFGLIEFTCPDDEAKRLAASNDVSIYVIPELVNGEGKRYEQPVRHVALTSYPVIPKLDDFECIAASYVSNIDELMKGDVALAGTYDESEHPRDEHGHWAAKAASDAAHKAQHGHDDKSVAAAEHAHGAGTHEVHSAAAEAHFKVSDELSKLAYWSEKSGAGARGAAMHEAARLHDVAGRAHASAAVSLHGQGSPHQSASDAARVGSDVSQASPHTPVKENPEHSQTGAQANDVGSAAGAESKASDRSLGWHPRTQTGRMTGVLKDYGYASSGNDGLENVYTHSQHPGRAFHVYPQRGVWEHVERGGAIKTGVGHNDLADHLESLHSKTELSEDNTPATPGACPECLALGAAALTVTMAACELTRHLPSQVGVMTAEQAVTHAKNALEVARRGPQCYDDAAQAHQHCWAQHKLCMAEMRQGMNECSRGPEAVEFYAALARAHDAHERAAESHMLARESYVTEIGSTGGSDAMHKAHGEDRTGAVKDVPGHEEPPITGAVLSADEIEECLALAGNWDESKHPRNKGKFTSGGAMNGTTNKIANANGKPKLDAKHAALSKQVQDDNKNPTDINGPLKNTVTDAGEGIKGAKSSPKLIGKTGGSADATRAASQASREALGSDVMPLKGSTGLNRVRASKQAEGLERNLGEKNATHGWHAAGHDIAAKYHRSLAGDYRSQADAAMRGGHTKEAQQLQHQAGLHDKAAGAHDLARWSHLHNIPGHEKDMPPLPHEDHSKPSGITARQGMKTAAAIGAKPGESWRGHHDTVSIKAHPDRAHELMLHNGFRHVGTSADGAHRFYQHKQSGRFAVISGDHHAQHAQRPRSLLAAGAHTIGHAIAHAVKHLGRHAMQFGKELAPHVAAHLAVHSIMASEDVAMSMRSLAETIGLTTDGLDDAALEGRVVAVFHGLKNRLDMAENELGQNPDDDDDDDEDEDADGTDVDDGTEVADDDDQDNSDESEDDDSESEDEDQGDEDNDDQDDDSDDDSEDDEKDDAPPPKKNKNKFRASHAGILRENRMMRLRSLQDEGKITRATRLELENIWCGEKALGIALSHEDGTNHDFDATVAALSKNVAARQGEKTHVQSDRDVLALSKSEEVTTANPLLANADRRKAEHDAERAKRR